MSIKENYEVREITKSEARPFIAKYHYLGEKNFMTIKAFGLFESNTNELVGVASYWYLQGRCSSKGWFENLEKETDCFELSRLAIHPSLNNGNITSYFLSKTIKSLKEFGVKCIVSLADSSIHVGYIYQACNFGYYGTTPTKSDFYCVDGTINPRGKVRDKQGVNIPRTKKYRYAIMLDKKIKVKYRKEDYPKKTMKSSKCCEDGVVYDKRYKKYYTCPKCKGELIEIGKTKNEIDKKIEECSSLVERLDKSEEWINKAGVSWDRIMITNPNIYNARVELEREIRNLQEEIMNFYKSDNGVI